MVKRVCIGLADFAVLVWRNFPARILAGFRNIFSWWILQHGFNFAYSRWLVHCAAELYRWKGLHCGYRFRRIWDLDWTWRIQVSRVRKNQDCTAPWELSAPPGASSSSPTGGECWGGKGGPSRNHSHPPAWKRRGRRVESGGCHTFQRSPTHLLKNDWWSEEKRSDWSPTRPKTGPGTPSRGDEGGTEGRRRADETEGLVVVRPKRDVVRSDRTLGNGHCRH